MSAQVISGENCRGAHEAGKKVSAKNVGNQVIVGARALVGVNFKHVKKQYVSF